MARSLLLLVLISLTACATKVVSPTESLAPGAPTPSFAAIYRPAHTYSLVTPEGDLHPGETRVLRWEPTQYGWSSTPAAPIHLCFAVIGAFSSIGDLKAFVPPRPGCPPVAAGIVLASDVVEVDQFSNAPVTQELRLPRTLAPGLYSFVQIVDSGGGNSMTASGVVTVVAAP